MLAGLFGTKRIWQYAVGNTAIYTAGHVLPQVVNVLLLPVFTRFLSPSEYGILGYTTAVCSFLTAVGHLSIHSFILSHYNECRSEEDRQTLICTILIFLLVYNLVLLALLFYVLPWFLRDSQIPFNPYVKFALWTMFLEIFGVVPMAWFRIREEAGRFVAFTAGQTLLSVALSVYLVVGRDMGVLGRYWGQLGADIVLLAVCVAVFGRLFRPRFSGSLLRRALVFSLPLAAAGFLDLLSTMSDRFFLDRNIPLSQMGLYTFGFSLGYGINALAQGMYKALEPTVFRLASESTIDEGILAMKRGVVMTMGIVGCLAIGFSRDALTLIAPEKFMESYKIVALTAVRVVIQGITIPIATYLVAVRLTKLLPLVCLWGAGTNLLLNSLLVPAFGMYGAAVAGIGSALATLVAYRTAIEGRSQVRWGYLADLVMLAMVFILSAIVLQLRLESIAVELAIRVIMMAMLVGVWIFRLQHNAKRLSCV